jgi:transcriptional regulator with XRE-family HTH domain
VQTQLRQIRLDRGLSQDELATALKCSQATIHQYEAGKTTHPRPALAKRFRDFFGLPFSAIIAPTKGNGLDTNVEAVR